MADHKEGLSREAARIVRTRRIKARGSIDHFRRLLDELCAFDNITDEVIHRTRKMLRICYIALIVDAGIFLAALRYFAELDFPTSTGQYLSRFWPLAVVAVLICLFAGYLWWTRIIYTRRDFLNDPFLSLLPLLQDVAQAAPRTMIKMELDLEGLCNRKITAREVNKNESLKTFRYIDYHDPWLKMTMEFDAASSMRVMIDNKVFKKISKVVTPGRSLLSGRRHSHYDKWVDWKKETTVKMEVFRLEDRPAQNRDTATAAPLSRRGQTYVFRSEGDPPWEVPPNHDLARMFKELYEILFPVSIEI